MPAESRENPLLKKGNSDAFFKEKYLTKNNYSYFLYHRISRVLAHVFAQAISYKEENDLTI